MFLSRPFSIGFDVRTDSDSTASTGPMRRGADDVLPEQRLDVRRTSSCVSESSSSCRVTSVSTALPPFIAPSQSAA